MSAAISDSLRGAPSTRADGTSAGAGVKSGLEIVSNRVGGSFASGTGVGRVAVLSFQMDIMDLAG